jgi:hypothetical protein
LKTKFFFLLLQELVGGLGGVGDETDPEGGDALFLTQHCAPAKKYRPAEQDLKLSFCSG